MFNLCFQDYTEDYIQTGPGQLYALSTRIFTIDRESVPYSWNHTITYDVAKGKMPYLVETLHASAIKALYHPQEEMLEYHIHATIAKGTFEKPLSSYSSGCEIISYFRSAYGVNRSSYQPHIYVFQLFFLF